MTYYSLGVHWNFLSWYDIAENAEGDQGLPAESPQEGRQEHEGQEDQEERWKC